MNPFHIINVALLFFCTCVALWRQEGWMAIAWFIGFAGWMVVVLAHTPVGVCS